MTFGCEMCDWTAEFKDGWYDDALKVCHQHYMSHSWLHRKWNDLLNLPARYRLRSLQSEPLRLLRKERCILKK